MRRHTQLDNYRKQCHFPLKTVNAEVTGPPEGVMSKTYVTVFLCFWVSLICDSPIQSCFSPYCLHSVGKDINTNKSSLALYSKGAEPKNKDLPTSNCLNVKSGCSPTLCWWATVFHNDTTKVLSSFVSNASLGNGAQNKFEQIHIQICRWRRHFKFSGSWGASPWAAIYTCLSTDHVKQRCCFIHQQLQMSRPLELESLPRLIRSNNGCNY